MTIHDAMHCIYCGGRVDPTSYAAPACDECDQAQKREIAFRQARLKVYGCRDQREDEPRGRGSMSPDEERAWAVVIANPLIRPRKLAWKAGIPLDLARSMLRRIGTPRRVWAQIQKEKFTAARR